MPPLARWTPPSKEKQLDAIGICRRTGKLLHTGDYESRARPVMDNLPVCLQPDHCAWNDIDPPERGEWLTEQIDKTPDQNFHQYVQARPNCPDRSRHTVYMITLCKADDLSKPPSSAGAFPSLPVIEAAVAAFFQMPVKWLDPSAIESLRSQIECRDNSHGKQYHAGQLLDALIPKVPRDAFCLMAITMKDLYPRPEWNFVYGLARLSQRVGVFSFARHDPCRGESERNVSEEASLMSRSLQTVLHEIDHMFGAKHCTWFNCLMRGNNGDGIEHQRPPLDLCPVCLRKLHWNVGFDIKGRYEDLLDVYKPLACNSPDLRREVQFLEQRVQVLTSIPQTLLPRNWAPPRQSLRQPSAGSESKARARTPSIPCIADRRISNVQVSSPASWKEAIEDVYRSACPAKVLQVDSILQKHQGKEAWLYAQICKKYGALPREDLPSA